ncbi:hypothetical protein IKE13_02095 [Candidatus Saccharibacteria bacterium]|nr:hypothetical protein [Candidatus Saccharibacteria bacterium]
MNKDVIYIEPEDDITDIISKIETSKSKIVALVPPKKAGVFRSVVNIKLIAKSAASASKTVVLVTTDPSITKLAASIKIPVTKNLQTAPSIPKIEEAPESTTEEDVIEQDQDIDDKSKAENTKDDVGDAASDDAPDDDGKGEAEKPEIAPENAKKKMGLKKSNNKLVAWFNEHRKVAIICGIGILLLIIVLVWALAIAPAATLTVGIKTELNNFSEAVSFTTKFDEEDANTGNFYLEEKKVETIKKVEFEATGQKNVGEKASGNLVVYTYFPITIPGGSTTVKAGTVFKIGNLSYTSDSDITLSWSGDLGSLAQDCGNYNSPSLRTSGCLISGRVAVTATAPGEEYNIAASNTGWSTSADVAVYSDKAMSGGTNEMITVVSKEDVEKAKEGLVSSDQDENKEKLLSEIGDNMMAIEASFSQVTEDAVSSPAIGEEVESGVKPTLTAKTIATIYIIDKTKVEEFITEKAKLGENQKIYEIRDPFIENFAKTDNGFSGKLKTSYATGPKVTENGVIEIVKGRGLGQAQHDLRDINGIISVTINPSFPWVTSIPNDPNKITVILEIKE